MAVHPSEYDRLVESVWKEASPEQMRNVWQTHAISYVRAMWKAETGRKMRWKVRIGTGNRRTWLHGSTFTVNPQQGWHDINHDMAHFIERRQTGGAHTNGHLNLERNGARLIVRKFLEKDPPPQKAKPDMITTRAARVDAGIKRWEAKLKRAATALKKLKQKKRYYAKKLAEPRSEPKPRKKLETLESLAETHGIELVKDFPSRIGVMPSDCDEDTDPHAGDHYVDGRREARLRVLEYAELQGS